MQQRACAVQADRLDVMDDEAIASCLTMLDASSDPFCEHLRRPFAVCKSILGGSFRFDSNSEALLRLVEAAYGGLPPQVLSPGAPAFRIEMSLLPRQKQTHEGMPPAVRTHAGAGTLCGVLDASNYVVITPDQRRALVVVSEDMLDHPYHARYELIEFVVFVLATRGLGLVPLHGACVGKDGRGILLLGASGAGKSTLALHGLLGGLDFLAEDAILVQPDGLLAYGVANFLHVRPDALRFVDAATQAWISAAPIIRRRSGVEKFEVDLRQGRGRLAPSPLALAGMVFMSSESSSDPAHLLSRVPPQEAATALCIDQPYAAAQQGWQRFQQQMTALDIYRMRRGPHPQASVDALLPLLT